MITPFSASWGFGAPVVKILIGINVALWVIMEVTQGFGWLPLDTWWYEYLAMSPENVLHKYRIYQVVTSMFIHDAFNILHLVLNMYFLWMFGTRIERTFGSAKFLGFYMAAGVSGSILSLVARTLLNQWTVPSLGASSAIFGLIVVYGFLFANEILLLFFFWRVTTWKAILGIVGSESILLILQLFNVNLGSLNEVDHWAHLGGAACAAVWMLVLQRNISGNRPTVWQKGPVFRRPTGQEQKVPPQRESKLFRVIITGNKPVHRDHPEGTDDEPPPDWFKP